jgi:hypothetical protein
MRRYLRVEDELVEEDAVVASEMEEQD